MTRYRALLFLTVTAVSFSSCACSKKRVLPDVDTTANFERYSTDNVLYSSILGEEILYDLLLPEGYASDKDKAYPVVYMLHGYGDNNNSWNGKYLHANATIKSLEAKGLGEMIYVFPQGFNSYYSNRYDGSFNYMDMFIEELVPAIDKGLRTIPDREHRAITGYSMGGFGAYVLAAKHHETFSCSAPLSMSFRTDDQYMAESQSGWNGQWGSIFGGKGMSGYARITDYYKEHCPFYVFNESSCEALSAVKWYFTCGDDEEQLLIANDDLHVLLRDLGLPHEFRVADGAHTSKYWMAALEEVLPMFDHCMNGASAWPEARTAKAVEAIDRLDDGSWASPLYEDSGTGLFIVHDGLSDDLLGKIMAKVASPTAKVPYVLLPCNLKEKSFSEWVEHWESVYGLDKELALAYGAGADAVLGKEMSRYIFVDADAGLEPSVSSDENIYLCCTDGAVNYAPMGALYKACKAAGCTFEYRVIASSSDRDNDILRCTETINNFIIY